MNFRYLYSVTFVAILLASPLTGPSFAERYGAQCGVELWRKKTLADGEASKVDLAPQDTTIAWLQARDAPVNPDAVTGRLTPIETKVWRLRAQLLGYKIEDDGDYHLVLRDQRGNEMIGEIPSPYCVSSRSAQYLAARHAIDRIGRHRASIRWRWLNHGGETPPTVTIWGAGFFDRLHEVAGAARNGAELHPVLGVSLT